MGPKQGGLRFLVLGLLSCGLAKIKIKMCWNSSGGGGLQIDI